MHIIFFSAYIKMSRLMELTLKKEIKQINEIIEIITTNNEDK